MCVSRDVGSSEIADRAGQGAHEQPRLARARTFARELYFGVRITVILKRLDREVAGGLLDILGERDTGLR